MNKTVAGKMPLVHITLVLSAVWFFCQGQAAIASGWERVGGIQLLYGTHPSEAGAYDWPWSGDNGDGTTTYGKYTFDKYGGEKYGILYVDNSIDSNDAYITQSFPISVPVGSKLQQFLAHAWPSGGATGIWVEIRYNNGCVDRLEAMSNNAWQTPYLSGENNGPGTATGYTVRIGVLKNPAVTSGLRSVLIDKALLWDYWLTTPEWENWTFDVDDYSNQVVIIEKDWDSVGGAVLTRQEYPAANPPGAYDWPWSADSGDGTTTYGKYVNFPKYGGNLYGVLTIDNSVDSYDAYITQTLRNVSTPVTGSFFAQQFLSHGAHSVYSDGVWLKMSYGTSEVDLWEFAPSQAWSHHYVLPQVDEAAGTEITIKIGIKKQPGVTTGTRSVTLDKLMLWDVTHVTPEWLNWTFDGDYSQNNICVTEAGETTDTYEVVLAGGPPSVGTVDITVDPDEQVRVNEGQAGASVVISFTSSNWNIPQTITVQAVDDSVFEEYNHLSIITHSVTASDLSYNGIRVRPVIVHVTDNDIPENNRTCYDSNAPLAMANTDFINEEELRLVSEYWLEPNALRRGEPIINLETFGQMAQDWLEPDEQQLWFDDALPFRAMLATWGGNGTGKMLWDVVLSDTTQWNTNLTTWKNEDYNTIVYLAANELTGNEQVFLTLDEFPEAKQTSDGTVAINRSQLQWLLAEGKMLGMNNFLYTLSVYWTRAFGTAHDLDEPMTVDEITVSWYHNAYPPNYNLGVYTPLTAAYSAAVWAEFSRTYEDLDGFYSPIGEAVPNLRRAEFYQDGIAPGLQCTDGRTSPKPLIIAHGHQMGLSDYLSGVAQSQAYDNVWLGYHAWNGEQICDAKPKPDIINWATQTGSPTVVALYPANSEAWPFNSPKLAAEIIAEMKQIPHIKGFVYWEHSGRLLSPLFRKALGYYSSRSDAYSDKPWLDILEGQFGNRTAAQHFLKAWNASGRIMAEECAVIYDESDWYGGEKELSLPYLVINSKQANTSPNRNMVSIQSYAQTIASNPGYDFGEVVTPPQQMAMIKTLGQEAFDEATAAIPYVTTNLSQAQDALNWMEGFKLISAYFELKVNAATAALIYKYGGGSSYRTQAESLAQQAYDAYITASDHLITNCRPIFQALYSTDLKTPNGKTLEELRTDELNDKNNMGSILSAW